MSPLDFAHQKIGISPPKKCRWNLPKNFFAVGICPPKKLPLEFAQKPLEFGFDPFLRIDQCIPYPNSGIFLTLYHTRDTNFHKSITLF